MGALSERSSRGGGAPGPLSSGGRAQSPWGSLRQLPAGLCPAGLAEPQPAEPACPPGGSGFALVTCVWFWLQRILSSNVTGFDTEHGHSAERLRVSLVLFLICLLLVLKEMEKSDANNFLILFRDSGCQFRSLYTYCPETEDIAKLTGIGPKAITKKMIEGLYKYNSDRKQFSHIPAKTLSASVDAITIHSHLWQTKRPVTPKKLLPSKA